jgi:hypothetical protein
MRLEFSGEIWCWRGPSPFYFVRVPQAESVHLQEISAAVSYGWGMIPVAAQIGHTDWSTALFPKDRCYLVPVKARIRQVEALEEGDAVTVRLEVRV